MPEHEDTPPHTDHSLLMFLRQRVDQVPTHQEVIGGQPVSYVRKEEVMGWIDDCLDLLNKHNR